MNRDELKELKVGDVVHVLCDEDPEAVESSEDLSDDSMPRGPDYVVVHEASVYNGDHVVAVSTAHIAPYNCSNWVKNKPEVADHMLFAAALANGVAHWEKETREFCMNGIRTCCDVDEHGVPVLHDFLRTEIREALSSPAGKEGA